MIVEIFSYVEKLQCGMKLDTRDITMIFWVDKKVGFEMENDLGKT